MGAYFRLPPEEFCRYQNCCTPTMFALHMNCLRKKFQINAAKAKKRVKSNMELLLSCTPERRVLLKMFVSDLTSTDTQDMHVC